MANYKISQVAKDDLIRIHQFGFENFGVIQADRYFENFFQQFELIAQNPLMFESVDFIAPGYRRCPCGVDSIFFRISNGQVEIMSIIGRQDLSELF
jgi:toxin ParE1/3/4